MPRLVLTASLVLLFTHPIHADWPQFRGPTGQGHAAAKALPLEWGPDRNVVWKVAIPGKGWSSPVVGGGRIYLTTAVPKGEGRSADQSLRALCLDAATGKTIWDVEVFHQNGQTAPAIHTKNSHASATPVLDGERLYVHFGHQGTACLKAADGSVVWSTREFTYPPVHGNGGSPVVWNGTLFFAIDSPERREVLALDKLTGAVRWRAKREQPAKRPFSFGTPLVIEIGGKPMVVSVGSDVVNAFDVQTGSELWSHTFEGYSVVPRPVFGHGMLFLSTGYDRPSLLALAVAPKGAGYAVTRAWETKTGAPNNPSPVLVGNELYSVSDGGIAVCLDARTGKVHWQERLPGAYSASLLAGAGRVYVQNESGTGTVLACGTTFEVLATNKLGERTLASLAVDGEALLIRTEKHLYRIVSR
jgi:outer membrane protein assembly factor BamB